MPGVTATQSGSWHWDAGHPDAGADAGPAPTLAAAPEGLSARRVERWLDLPPGAWQKRRLFALRLKANSFAQLGFRQGDLVIVEPGAREQAGSMVVTRSTAGLSLRKVAKTSSHERMPTVLELPLRERTVARPERVVGTVVGHLRETGTGALRPLGSASRSAGHRAVRPARELPSGTKGRRTRYESVLRVQQQWRRWIDARRAAMPAGEDLERWERLDASLGTLCECLSRTHNPELREALLEEAGIVAATIHSEMRR